LFALARVVSFFFYEAEKGLKKYLQPYLFIVNLLLLGSLHNTSLCYFGEIFY